jgi:uncharacterized protein YjbI with pentapeptide repeats
VHRSDLRSALLGRLPGYRIRGNDPVFCLRASLADTRLQGANLADANLEGANLSWAFPRGADLGEARGLTQAQLDAARGDARTQLPDGLRQPDGWAAGDLSSGRSPSPASPPDDLGRCRQ